MAKRIPLTRGRFAIVDDADFEWLSQWNWHYSGRGYATRKAPRNGGHGAMIWMRREILGLAAGGWLVDHKNCNKLDNTRANLRLCSKAENCRNKTAHNKNNTSGYMGVTWTAPKRLWHARIGYEWTRIISMGRYKDPKRAAEAYDFAAIMLHGDFATLNFKENQTCVV